MKRATIILAISLVCLGATAQEFNRSEFSINAGVGVSSFQTQPTEGKAGVNWTSSIGAGYHFFFNPSWGIGTGANFAVYNDGLNYVDYNKQQATTNVFTGHAFDFKVSIPNYREIHQVMMATIPLMLQYQSTGKTIIYASVGGKAGIPFSAKSRGFGRITSTGYFPGINVTYENLPEYGFVNDQRFPKDKSDIKMETAFMASAELGIKWVLVKKMCVYTGLYVDYGLNDLLNKPAGSGNANLVVYQPQNAANFAYNTALHSYSKQMVPLAIGVTVRLAGAKVAWDKNFFRFRNE